MMHSLKLSARPSKRWFQIGISFSSDLFSGIGYHKQQTAGSLTFFSCGECLSSDSQKGKEKPGDSHSLSITLWGWSISTVDVKTAFLQAPRRATPGHITVVQPPQILKEAEAMESREEQWPVTGALYGLIESPKDWGDFRNSKMEKMAWQSSREAVRHDPKKLYLNSSGDIPPIWMPGHILTAIAVRICMWVSYSNCIISLTLVHKSWMWTFQKLVTSIHLSYSICKGWPGMIFDVHGHILAATPPKNKFYLSVVDSLPFQEVFEGPNMSKLMLTR